MSKRWIWCFLLRYLKYVVLMEETGVPGKTTDWLQVTDKLYHIMLYPAHLAWTGFKLTSLLLIGNDCICSYKSKCHAITTTMAHWQQCPSVGFSWGIWITVFGIVKCQLWIFPYIELSVTNWHSCIILFKYSIVWRLFVDIITAITEIDVSLPTWNNE